VAEEHGLAVDFFENHSPVLHILTTPRKIKSLPAFPPQPSSLCPEGTIKSSTGELSGLPKDMDDSANAEERPRRTGLEGEGNRLSFSSLFSLGSTIYSAVGPSAAPSVASSMAGSLNAGSLNSSVGIGKGEALPNSTDHTSVTSNPHSIQTGLLPTKRISEPVNPCLAF
jgi:hypothetical protein